ncbi:MAG: DUF2007 domain-containing protein [Candidatus Marinimicrobia bacterium]|nr:DUF2007 domain-containing protein [Candidatus Neomarinimicrobiota bacterium]
MKYCLNKECLHYRRNDDYAEYGDDALICFDCNTELVSQKPISIPTNKYPNLDYNLKLLVKILDPLEAEFIKAKLIDSGVEAILFDSNIGNIYGGAITFMFGGIRLMVPETHYELAVNLYNQYQINKEDSEGIDFDEAGDRVCCPACRDNSLVYKDYRPWIMTLLSLLIFGGIAGAGFAKLNQKRHYCRNCDKYWKDDEVGF